MASLSRNSISSLYNINYNRDIVKGYNVDGCLFCKSDSIKTGVGFRLKINGKVNCKQTKSLIENYDGATELDFDA